MPLRDLFGRRHAPVSVPAAEDPVEPIAGCADRSRVRLRGTLSMLRVRSRGATTTPWLEALLSDETGEVTLVWMGRREIPGIHDGRRIEVDGRISTADGKRRIYNPVYTLLA